MISKIRFYGNQMKHTIFGSSLKWMIYIWIIDPIRILSLEIHSFMLLLLALLRDISQFSSSFEIFVFIFCYLNSMQLINKRCIQIDLHNVYLYKHNVWESQGKKTNTNSKQNDHDEWKMNDRWNFGWWKCVREFQNGDSFFFFLKKHI